MKRLYTNLVTAKPPREIKGETLPSVVQDLSSCNPTIKVPQGEDALAERARSLLLYDAALTPSDLAGAYGIEPWALDTARVIRAAKIAGDQIGSIDLGDLPHGVRQETQKILEHYSSKGQYIQAEAANARMEMLTGLPLMHRSTRDAIADTDWASWESTVNFARKLMQDRQESGENPGKAPGKGGDGDEGDEGESTDQPDDSWLGHGEDDSDDGPGEKPAPQSVEAKEREQLEKSVLPNPNTGSKPRISKFDPDPWSKGLPPRPTSDPVCPGKLENPDKPDMLVMQNRRRKDGVRRRPEMEGAVPSKWHRLLVDRKIFTGAKMRGGMKGRGTVLVDMSGSMSWSTESFQQLLEALPECTVYGYAGYSGGTHGRICVLADRGKSATMESVSQWKSGKGSNIVDDSALRFLAKCSKPRVWISDGEATGCRDRQSPYIHTLCNAAIVAGGIIRVPNARQAVKVLLGR